MSSMHVHGRICAGLLAVFLGYHSTAIAQVPAPLPAPHLHLTEAGEVRSLAVQPDGSLLLAGAFSAIDGVARNGLARLLPDGTLDADWNPQPGWIAPVFDWPRRVTPAPDGGIFVTGEFDSMGGQPASCMARLLPDGTLDTQWSAVSARCGVAPVFDADGWMYYVDGIDSSLRRVRADTGGAADPSWSFGGHAFMHLVYDGVAYLYALDHLGQPFKIAAATGLSDPQWAASVSPIFPAALLLDGAGALYIGSEDGRIVKLSAGDGTAIAAWSATETPWLIRDFATDATGDLFVAYSEGVARFAGDSGQAQRHWKVGLVETVHQVRRRGDGKLVVAGLFRDIDAQARLSLALLDPAAPDTLAAVADAEAQPVVRQLAALPDGGSIVRGAFARADGLSRPGLLRLNADGSLDPTWRVAPNGDVLAIGTDAAGRVYAGGNFSAVNGQAREFLARFDGVSGVLDASWAPQANDTVDSLVVDVHGQVYFHGSGALRRARADEIGSIDPAWSIDSIFGSATLLTLADDRLYIGTTDESSIGQVRRTGPGVAAMLDAGWSVGLTGGGLDAMAVDADGGVLLGGSFTAVNSATQSAAVRVGSAAPALVDSAWTPMPDGAVTGFALATDGSIYVSGAFAAIGGEARPGIAKLSALDGSALGDWMPRAGGRSLQRVGQDRLFVLGAPLRSGLIAYPLVAGDTIFATAME